MDSFTITFSGKESTLESVFFPPIDLQGEYQIGLVDFQSYNSIYNVNAPNNKLYYYVPKELTNTPKGSMTLAELNKKLKDTRMEFHMNNKRVQMLWGQFKPIRTKGFFKSLILSSVSTDNEKINVNENIWYIDLNERKTIVIPEGSYEISEIEKEVVKTIPDFKLVPNNVLMNCTLKSSVMFDFNSTDGLGTKMLGFTGFAEPNIWYYSSHKVNINNVNVIRIKCNIASGSFINGKPDHTIHSFFPLVPPGFKLVVVPQNIIYFPINVRTLDVVTITLVDQDDKIVSFHNEEITLRCHIKKIF